MSDAARYELSSHARAVLAEREIPVAWVERVLSAPDRTEPDSKDPSLRHALGSIPEHGGRVLRVVYNPQVEPPLVVTAYFDRRERRRG